MIKWNKKLISHITKIERTVLRTVLWMFFSGDSKYSEWFLTRFSFLRFEKKVAEEEEEVEGCVKCKESEIVGLYGRMFFWDVYIWGMSFSGESEEENVLGILSLDITFFSIFLSGVLFLESR